MSCLYCNDAENLIVSERSTFHSTPAPRLRPGSIATGREDVLTQGNDYEPTQDSVIDDSGFIPSTPPAKKVRFIFFAFYTLR